MRTIEGRLDASGLRFGIIASRFNKTIVDQLVIGAHDALVRHGAADDDITLAWVPGAFELAPVAGEIIETGSVDAVVCVGVVIRGATDHYRYVAGEAASGIAAVARATRTPVVFGVLTTDTIDEALERAGTKAGNKGWDAALSAIESAHVLRQVRRLHKSD